MGHIMIIHPTLCTSYGQAIYGEDASESGRWDAAGAAAAGVAWPNEQLYELSTSFRFLYH